MNHPMIHESIMIQNMHAHHAEMRELQQIRQAKAARRERRRHERAARTRRSVASGRWARLRLVPLTAVWTRTARKTSQA